MKSEVVFQCQDKTKHVEKDVMMCLKRFRDEYFEKDRIVLSDSCDFDVFCHFIDFLVSGCIPRDKNDQIGVINLLREWESCFVILNSFRSRLCGLEKDGIVVYNGEEYEVNIGCLLFHCGVFREFYKNSCGMVFAYNSSYSRESFEVFLDLIHNRISYPSVEKAGDVYDICNCLHCDSLCQLLNDDSSERVLSLLIQNQDHNDSIDFSKYERSITQNIDEYLKNPSFCWVSLPSLCRIFAHSIQTFSLSSLEQFLIGCMKHHGIGAKILLNNIKYQKLSDLSELIRFLQIMSIEDTNDIYDNTNHVLSSFQRELESLRVENRQQSETIQQIVSEMNTRLKEQENINKRLESAINSAQATIGEQNNKIQEKDSKLAENARLIQAKDATINEKVQQIKELNQIYEYPYQADLFSGIFNGLSKRHGNDLTKDVIVRASSTFNDGSGDCGKEPSVVLKNDKIYWTNQNDENPWIEFDFGKRKVSITSYSMHIRYFKINSWKIEGSVDGKSWDILGDEKNNDLKIDLKNMNNFNYDPSMKNFEAKSNHKYYQQIRITCTSKNVQNSNYFNLYCVELFGYVKEDH